MWRGPVELPRPGTWSHVPGYDSDSDEDSETETKEQEEADIVAGKERFQDILQVLGERWLDPPPLQFSPPQVRQKGDRTPQKRAEERPRTTSSSNPCFNMDRTPAPVVHDTFLSNGLCEAGHGQDWCIQWSGPGMKDSAWSEIHEFQRVNHFPGSTALTRKDSMYTHLSQMVKQFGKEVFDFLPETYVLPEQMQAFMAEYERGGGLWIVKPANSACGRGIFILRDISNLPGGSAVVSRYVESPLLIQGLKFDLRVYVLVTQYDPLRAYIYREGLARFASKPYSTEEEEHLQDAYRHLTNYSINKSAPNFMENQDLLEDNYGHKWSLSALNRHLRCVGVDHEVMWSRIMDLIVKTLLAVEPPISEKTKKVTMHSGVCFEIYGFDVLVDEDLKPWILEVNLSPSMQADSPLDWQVKSSMLSDAFNLIGVCHADFRSVQTSKLRGNLAKARLSHKALIRERGSNSMSGLHNLIGKRHSDGHLGKRKSGLTSISPLDVPVVLDTLTEAQLKLLARSLQEQHRCQNFIRLYPTRGTIERYRPIMEARNHMKHRYSSNFLLASLLFGPTPRKASMPTSTHLQPAQSKEGTGYNASLRSSYVASLRRSLVALQLQKAPDPASRCTGSSETLSPTTPSTAVPDTEDSSAENSETPQPESQEDKVRRAAQFVAELEPEDKHRLVLMEYLARMVRSCQALGAEDRAALAQSGAFSRLSKFRARLLQLTRAVTQHPDDHFSRSQQRWSRHVADSGNACLVEEVVGACRTSMDLLASLPWRSQQAADSDEDDVPREAQESGRRTGHSPWLPEDLSLDGPRRQALSLLPVLGPAELEGILRSSDQKKESSHWADLFASVDGSGRPYSPLRDVLQAKRKQSRFDGLRGPSAQGQASIPLDTTKARLASEADEDMRFTSLSSRFSARRGSSMPPTDAAWSLSLSSSLGRGRTTVMAGERVTGVPSRTWHTSASPSPPPQPLHVTAPSWAFRDERQDSSWIADPAPSVSRQWSAPLLPDLKAMQKQTEHVVRQKPPALLVGPSFGVIEL